MLGTDPVGSDPVVQVQGKTIPTSRVELEEIRRIIYLDIIVLCVEMRTDCYNCPEELNVRCTLINCKYYFKFPIKIIFVLYFVRCDVRHYVALVLLLLL